MLNENEELFKTKGGNLFMKVGASSNEVHVMKKRIKQLEAEKKNIERQKFSTELSVVPICSEKLGH